MLAFTLPEALWLAGHGHDDLVVAYPTVDRARAARARAAGPRERVTVMVDCRRAPRPAVAAVREAGGGPVRVCLDVDAGWWPLGGRLRIGARALAAAHARAGGGARARDRRAAGAACSTG